MVTSPPDVSETDQPAATEDNSTAAVTDVAATQFPILLFAGLKEAAQTANILVRVEHDGQAKIPLHQVLEACAQQYPHLARWLPHVRVAVNQEYSATDGLIGADDEIALLPPVAGGFI